MNPKFLAPAILALSLPAHAALIAHYEFNDLSDTTGTTGSLVVNDRSGTPAYTVSGGFLSLTEVSINDSTFDYLTAPNFGFGAADAWTLTFDVRDNGSGGAGGQSSVAAIISSQSPGKPEWWPQRSIWHRSFSCGSPTCRVVWRRLQGSGLRCNTVNRKCPTVLC